MTDFNTVISCLVKRAYEQKISLKTVTDASVWRLWIKKREVSASGDSEKMREATVSGDYG